MHGQSSASDASDTKPGPFPLPTKSKESSHLLQDGANLKQASKI